MPLSPDRGRESSSASGDGAREVSVRELPVTTRAEAERARRTGRAAARTAGLRPEDAEAVAVATMELATNLVRYAEDGVMRIAVLEDGERRGVEIESRDRGPGIEHLDLALRDHYSTGGGLGSGLPAVGRLMDEFFVSTTPEGTQIVARKWGRPR